MSKFDDIKGRGLISNRIDELLQKREVKSEQPSIGEQKFIEHLHKNLEDIKNTK